MSFVVEKEYKQLHDLNVFKPHHKEELTKDQLDKCLRLITLIKEKRCGKIKGRACADGRSQRAYIPKEEAAAPAVSLDSLMLTLMTDAYEGNDVATCDITGACTCDYNMYIVFSCLKKVRCPTRLWTKSRCHCDSRRPCLSRFWVKSRCDCDSRHRCSTRVWTKSRCDLHPTSS